MVIFVPNSFLLDTLDALNLSLIIFNAETQSRKDAKRYGKSLLRRLAIHARQAIKIKLYTLNHFFTGILANGFEFNNNHRTHREKVLDCVYVTSDMTHKEDLFSEKGIIFYY